MFSQTEHSLDLSDGGVSDDGLDNGGGVLRGDVDDVEDSSGKTSVGKDLREDEVGARGELGGLQDGNVSGNDGLSASALGKNERCVPRSSACVSQMVLTSILARWKRDDSPKTIP